MSLWKTRAKVHHPMLSRSSSLNPFGMPSLKELRLARRVTLVANAFGVSPEIVQLSMLGAVDSQGFGAVGVGNLRSSEP